MSAQRIIDYSLMAVGVGACLITMALMAKGDLGYYDFDLYYFAGVLERGGTYTDTQSLFALVANAGLKAHVDGAYGTPPLVGLVFQPLSLLPLSTAHGVWNLATAGALVGSMRKLVPDPRSWLAYLALVIFGPAMMLGFQLQNFSVLTFCLLAYCYGSLRDGQLRRAGVILGVATALKLYPFFLLVAMALCWPRSRVVVTWCLGTGAVLCLACIPALGAGDALTAFRAMTDLAGFVPVGDNVGLPGWVARIGASQATAKVINIVASLMALVVLIRLRRLQLHLLFAAAIGLMLVSQSISWREYFSMFVIGLVALRSTKPRRMVWAIAVALVLVATQFQRYAVLFPGGAWLSGQVFAPSTLAGLGLAALLATALLRSSGPRPMEPVRGHVSSRAEVPADAH